MPRIRMETGSRLDLVFHAITGALDDHRLGMVKEAVEQGGGEGTVIVEDLGPLFESAIGGNDKRAAFIAPADDLEEQVRAVFIDGKVAQLIEYQKTGLEILVKFSLKLPGGLSGGEGIDDIDGGGKEHRIACQASGMAQCVTRIALPQTDPAEEDDVGLVVDKLQAEQVLDLKAIDLFGPTPVELLEGFEHGEVGEPDPALGATVLA